MAQRHFCASALSEGISNAVVEAMASGVPVVTTVCGGMQEAVSDGIEGRLVSLRDVNGLAESIKELSRNPELRARMGAAGRRRAARDFRPDVQAKQFRALYDEAIQFHNRETIRSKREAMHNHSISPADPASQDLSRKNPGQKPNAVHLVTVAELHWRNGHEYAMEAVKLLKDRGFPVKYTLVGNGPFLEAVGFARYQLGLIDDVQLVMDDERGEEFLSNADLFLLASVADGASHALEPAIDGEIPIVCSDLDSFITATSVHRKCRIVKRRDPEAMADAVVNLLFQDRDFRSGQNGSLESKDQGHSLTTGMSSGST